MHSWVHETVHACAHALIARLFDKDKKVLRRITELYFYPYWDTVEANAAKLRAEKDKIWKVGTFREELEFKLRNDYTKLKMLLKSIKQMRG